MESFAVLWETVLKKLEEFYEQKGDSFAFKSYVQPISPEYEENGRFFFKVPSALVREQIQQRFYVNILDAMREQLSASGQSRAVEIVLLTPEELDQNLLSRQKRESRSSITLRPAFTFENFVVGSSNAMAHAAALAVAKNPGLGYNPLLIYGGVGLGKTHLMHAIGNRILENAPDTSIIYITTEAFTNEYIDSIQRGTIAEFREKLRSADVLMIDDIQFIGSRRADRTQEELFYTFNTLFESERQIILTSDKRPSEIPRLEERLLSRFNNGLLADISLPDYETRVAILRSKSGFIKELLGFSLEIDDEVFHYIASREESNIRDLEGALKRVIASAKLNKLTTSVDIELARVALKDFFSEPASKAVTPALVIRTVCEYYDVREDDIMSAKRNKEIAFPRQVIMYILKDMTDYSNQKISESVGRGDHTTAIYAYDKIKEMMGADPTIQDQISDITARIRE